MAGRRYYQGTTNQANYMAKTPSQSPGQAAGAGYRGTRSGARAVTQRGTSYGPKHLLTAELLAGLVIVLVRLVADYDPVSDGTVKGKIGHPAGEYGPMMGLPLYCSVESPSGDRKVSSPSLYELRE